MVIYYRYRTYIYLKILDYITVSKVIMCLMNIILSYKFKYNFIADTIVQLDLSDSTCMFQEQKGYFNTF